MTAPRIAVFGSSLVTAEEPAYAQARALGQRLAEAGYEIWNGGYLGVMSAVSEGAREAGGRSVGVTVRAWDEFHPGNAWLSEKVAADDLHDRLRHLTNVDAAIALHGGIGTLTEVALFWSISQLGRLATLAARRRSTGLHVERDTPAEVVAKLVDGSGSGVPSRPLLLVGEAWASLVDALGSTLAIGPADRELVTMVGGIEDCVPTLRRMLPDPGSARA
jgi:uncharacterized protein (TIGR00730 family)